MKHVLLSKRGGKITVQTGRTVRSAILHQANLRLNINLQTRILLRYVASSGGAGHYLNNLLYEI
jgi:hypothetical protein